MASSVAVIIKSSSQGLKALTTMPWNMEYLICLRLASNPVDDAGLLSFATFSWLTPVMVRGYKHTLTVDTLPPLSPYDSSDTNAKRYQDSLGSPQERSLPYTGAHEPFEFFPSPGVEMDTSRSLGALFGGCWVGLTELVVPISGEVRYGESWCGKRTACELQPEAEDHAGWAVASL